MITVFQLFCGVFNSLIVGTFRWTRKILSNLFNLNLFFILFIFSVAARGF